MVGLALTADINVAVDWSLSVQMSENVLLAVSKDGLDLDVSTVSDYATYWADP